MYTEVPDLLQPEMNKKKSSTNGLNIFANDLGSGPGLSSPKMKKNTSSLAGGGLMAEEGNIFHLD